nr:RNA-dependent RNA polymerase [Colletotrichum fructicola ourmia-like virus 2]
MLASRPTKRSSRPPTSRLGGNSRVNSASGSRAKRCVDCSRAERHTKETVHNGMLLIRLRFGLPNSELPDCNPSELGRFLSFLLLQGKERASVAFPRRQVNREDGLCNLQRLCRRDRWELAHALSSIKRNLPAGCVQHTPSSRLLWEENATSKPPPSSSEFLAFVKKEITRIFPPGWDRNYGSFVGSHLPNPTSRYNKDKPADLAWLNRRSDFFTCALQETEVSPVFCARYKEVLSAGKCRPLLIYDEKIDLLAPLHKLIYSHIRKTDWLLCGPPTEKRMKSVCVKAYQTSVDLVAATDNLRHDVADEILDAMFFTSVKIPRSVRALAHGSLSPLFKDSRNIWRRVRHGQMMGAYLSFPLLCLQSYLAARWATRLEEGARILINGDDCVISADRIITKEDYPRGFILNDNKTIRAPNVVEINSTAFIRQGKRWREVRHLRRGGAVSDYVGVRHMAEAVRDTPYEPAFQRARIGRHWGFMPSQLGHRSYPAFLRERGMVKRVFTPLPERKVSRDTRLRIYRGEPSEVEKEVLRSFLWTYGRVPGQKRDVFNPTHGYVRRTYGYRSRPYIYRLSYVNWACKLDPPARKKDQAYFLPEEFIPEEEQKGLNDLATFGDHWYPED